MQEDEMDKVSRGRDLLTKDGVSRVGTEEANLKAMELLRGLLHPVHRLRCALSEVHSTSKA